jgi:hypothetical protein
MKTKNLNLFNFSIITLFLFSTITYSQVGIGTTDPQETLHVEGTLRITNTNQGSVDAIKIGGIDENGTYREITIGENIALKENVLSATSAPRYTFGSITLPSGRDHHNVDLLLEPGEANHGVNIIRVFASNNTHDKPRFSGIKAGVDGQVIWLYPQPDLDELELRKDHNGSLEVNRILESDKMKAKTDDNEMIKLIYDGYRQRWVLMYWHS